MESKTNHLNNKCIPCNRKRCFNCFDFAHYQVEASCRNCKFWEELHGDECDTCEVYSNFEALEEYK